MNLNIKSKERIKDFGEVFTSKKEIINMLKLIPDFTHINNSILEPTCGHGNFIEEILLAKLNKNIELLKKNINNKILLDILNSIHGMDIQEDNVFETKIRMINSIKDFYIKNKIEFSTILLEKCNLILNKNILCGNFLENYENYKNMYAIIGNPPYQKDDGGFGSSASPLYNLFMEIIIENLKPNYFSFIIPSRWLTGGKGLKNFRKKMLNDLRFKELYDFKNSKDCFSNVEIEGGVCYFLWDKNYNGNIKYSIIENNKIDTKIRIFNEYDIFIRNNIGIDILNKVKVKNIPTIENNIKRPPFGFNTNFKDFKFRKDTENNIKYYGNKLVIPINEKIKQDGVGYISIKQVEKGTELVLKYKILIAKARGGIAKDKKIVTKPILTEPNSVCSQTYIMVKNSDNKEDVLNFKKYIETKFFRFLLSLRKQTQDVGISTYSFVPNVFLIKKLNDFISNNKTIQEIDNFLFNYFELNDAEIKYIEYRIDYY